jgi:hypothetical protein
MEIIVQYGLYTVKDLERFSRGLVARRTVRIMSDCEQCAFVFDGTTCPNCNVSCNHKT